MSLGTKLVRTFIVECTAVEIVIIVHHAKQALTKDLGAAKTCTVHTVGGGGGGGAYGHMPLHKISTNKEVGLYYVMGIYYGI